MSRTKAIMTFAAVACAAGGLAASFLPEELLRWSGATASGFLPIVVQLYGSALLGFAMLDWMAKESTIGGIYNRPIAIANLLHFVSGAFALLKYATRATPPLVIGATAAYALLAVAFALIMFTSPVKH
ncbi:MAG TPA: hypothetical protein VND45_09355 [Thermoanaerobaculia bacterium]|nr:hypothetical protein [Thermoanaerobaculia bacterium]